MSDTRKADVRPSGRRPSGRWPSLRWPVRLSVVLAAAATTLVIGFGVPVSLTVLLIAAAAWRSARRAPR